MCIRDSAESARGWAEAFVMREMSAVASNHRANATLVDWLKRNKIVAIDGVDTRKLTRQVRTGGSQRCVVSTLDGDPKALLAKARAMPSTDERDLTPGVTCKEPYSWSKAYEESY